MDKVEREHLKHDRFIEEVTHSVDYVAGHRKQFRLYGGVAIVAFLVGLGVWFWMGKQSEARQADLREALKIQDAAVGPGSNPYLKSFPTQAEKNEAAIKAFSELAAKYPSKAEGAVAKYYMGVIYADQGKFAEAEKNLQSAIDAGSDEYGSLSRLSLAQLYNKQNKKAEAEKLLKAVIDSPTILVSKEQAQIELAKVLAETKPEEAKKLLEPLRTSQRGPVSRWAITTYGELKLN